MVKKEIKNEEGIVPVDIKVIGSKVEMVLVEAQNLVIKTDEDELVGSKLLSNIKLFQKAVKDQKDKQLKPALETTKQIRGFFAPSEEKAEEAERLTKLKLGNYFDKKEADRKKKEDAIAVRVEKGQIKEETGLRKLDEIGETKTNVKTEEGATIYSKVKEVEVIDESKVPDQYWKLDLVAIRRDALAIGNLGEVIPGVIVKEVTSVGGRV